MRRRLFVEIALERFHFAARLFVPAQQAKIGPPLSATLTFVGVDVEEFCRLSNVLSSFLEEGVKFPIYLFKNNKQMLEVTFNSFFFSDLSASLAEEGFAITFLLIYQVFFFKNFLLNFSIKTLNQKVRSFVGTLFSLDSFYFPFFYESFEF